MSTVDDLDRRLNRLARWHRLSEPFHSEHSDVYLWAALLTVAFPVIGFGATIGAFSYYQQTAARIAFIIVIFGSCVLLSGFVWLICLQTVREREKRTYR